MKRGTRFFIGFLSAAITFTCLMAFVGPRYSGMRYGDGWHHGWHNRYYDNNRYPYQNNYPPPYWQQDSMRRQPDNF